MKTPFKVSSSGFKVQGFGLLLLLAFALRCFAPVVVNPFVSFPASGDPNTPPVTANLMVQIDAERDDANWNDNAAVGTVTDWSGNSYSPTQGTAGNKPTFKTGIVNSRAVYRCDGGDYAAFPSGALGIFNNQGGGTIYLVVSASSLTGELGPVFFSRGGSSTSSRLRVARNGSNFTYGGRRTDADSFQTITGSTTLSTSTFYVVSAVFDWSNSNLYGYVNGAADASTTSFQTDGNTSATNSDAANFASLLTTSQFWAGDIAMLLVYRGAHGTSDRQSVEDWLGTRFNITITH